MRHARSSSRILTGSACFRKRQRHVHLTSFLSGNFSPFLYVSQLRFGVVMQDPPAAATVNSIIECAGAPWPIVAGGNSLFAVSFQRAALLDPKQQNTCTATKLNLTQANPLACEHTCKKQPAIIDDEPPPIADPGPFARVPRGTHYSRRDSKRAGILPGGRGSIQHGDPKARADDLGLYR